MTRGAAVTAAAAVWPRNATASAAAASMPIAVRTKITLRPHMALFRLPGLPVDKVPPVVPDNQNPKGPLEPGATRPKSASPLHLGRAQSTITPDPVTHIPPRAIGSHKTRKPGVAQGTVFAARAGGTHDFTADSTS